MSIVTLGTWIRLQPGDKLRSSISKHEYEIKESVEDPFQVTADWRVCAYMTTEGKRITFSRLWQLVCPIQADVVEPTQADLEHLESGAA